MRAPRSAWAAGVVLLLAATPAAAQVGGAPSPREVAQAREAFTRGQRAYVAGDYARSLDEFQESFALSGAPELLYNIGQAADRLRRDADALAAFRAYLREVPEAEDRAAIDARIRALEVSVATEAAERRNARDRERALAAQIRMQPGVMRDDRAPAVWERWWFWAIVGTAVVATVAVSVVLGSRTETAAPTPGTDGGVIVALSW